MKTRSGRKGRAPSAESLRKLIAYQIYEDDFVPIRSARRERKWMDDADGKFPYRCLPLIMANQYGWEILSTHRIRASWDGTPKPDGVSVENLSGDDPLQCDSHFGGGVLTFQIPFLFKTPASWNLMVRGPMNSPKDGITALDGIVETDWSHSTFTMNWRFTRACTVEFALGEPICHFFPIQRGALETFRGEFRMLESKPDFKKKFQQWYDSRERFLSALAKRRPEAIAQGWQKEYLQSAKDKKSVAHPFVNEKSWSELQRMNGNCEESR